MDVQFMAHYNMITILQRVIFAAFILTFGISIISAIKNNLYNKSQPVIDVSATVVGKRQKVKRSRNNNMNHHHHTYYYVTFEFKSGDRKEYQVSEDIYGLIIERDNGNLKFQGNKFLDFQRM